MTIKPKRKKALFMRGRQASPQNQSNNLHAPATPLACARLEDLELGGRPWLSRPPPTA